MNSSSSTPGILYLHDLHESHEGAMRSGSGRARLLEAACTARGLPFLCPDLRAVPPLSRSEVVLRLLDRRVAALAIVGRAAEGVLTEALARWRRRHPGAPSPVAAVLLCAPAPGVRPPEALGVPTRVVHGPGIWGQAVSCFSEVSGRELWRPGGPRLTFGALALSELRGRPDTAAEAADVLLSAYGTASHPRETHLRRLTTSSGLLVWARADGRLVGCSQVRGDGKWGACGTLPAYRGLGIGLRLARLAQRRFPGQFVEVGRDTPHAVRLVLGCGFRPVRDERTVRSVVRSSVGREIGVIGVDELGVVYRRLREGGGHTGPLRLYVAGRPRRWAEAAGDQQAEATAATSGNALPVR
ncbi:GNAT family N-acetyltransferase [Streptomyces sp. NPDC052309]|uniref:GNAT family N-acetyltransferase n=1 Tax=Streptomyces sp. NPDC052309 TaxID=3155421 RepID=UPI0034477457